MPSRGGVIDRDGRVHSGNYAECAVYRKHGWCTHCQRLRAARSPQPSGGRGHPAGGQEPLKLAAGLSSTWSRDLENYLSHRGELGADRPTETARVLAALQRHNPRYHDIYVRRLVDNLSVAELARLYGLKPARVHEYLSRARRFVREQFELACKESGVGQ